MNVGWYSNTCVDACVDCFARASTGGNVLGGFAASGRQLGKTVYVETFRGLSNLLIGTSNVVKRVTKLAEGAAGAAPRPPHARALDTGDVAGGFAQAGREIARGFADGFVGVFVR